jgi:hypothetical protein
MKRIIFFFAFAATTAASSLFAQSDFRSAGSGIWTNSQNWEENENGIWLKPINGIYPGERHNRDANVTITDDNTMTIGIDEVIQVHSMCIMNGTVLIEGTLILSPATDDPGDIQASFPDSITIQNSKPTTSDNPQLLQNIPNPLAPQCGYQTMINFYLDKQYSNVHLAIYDQLGHVIQKIFDEQTPAQGWHTFAVNLDGIMSGSYLLILELPNTVLQRMITILR